MGSIDLFCFLFFILGQRELMLIIKFSCLLISSHFLHITLIHKNHYYANKLFKSHFAAHHKTLIYLKFSSTFFTVRSHQNSNLRRKFTCSRRMFLSSKMHVVFWIFQNFKNCSIFQLYLLTPQKLNNV